MKGTEFREWLVERGITDKAAEARLRRAQRAERSLRSLGVEADDLDAAFELDEMESALAALKAQLLAYRRDGTRPLASLVPQAPDPTAQLTNVIAATRRYRDFRARTPIASSAWPELDAMRERFLDNVPDFTNFTRQDGIYWGNERRYKDEMLSAVAEIVSSDDDDESAGRRIYRALIPNSGPMLRWQTDDAFHRTHPELASEFYSVIGRLGRVNDGLRPAAEAAAADLAGLRSRGAKVLAVGQQLAIILTVLAFARPHELGPFKITRAQELSETLIGSRLFRSTQFDPEDVARWIELNARIFAVMQDDWRWQPRDMFDVQGFAWVALDKEWMNVDDDDAADGDDAETRDADLIRTHAMETYIIPARESGASTVTIHVRAVDEAVGAKGHWRNVCSALRGKKFLAMAGVPAPQRIGAEESPATKFVFSLVSTEADTAQDSQIRASSLILYGPPGTGKTYATAKKAVQLCDGQADYPATEAGRAQLMERYRALADVGRIEFVTFHQNFSYEDFVEGLRPDLGENDSTDERTSTGFRLKAEPGVFYRISRRAETSIGARRGGFRLDDRRIWKMSIGEAAKSEDAYLFEEAIEHGRLLLGWGNTDWSDARFENRDAILEEASKTYVGDKPLTAAHGWVKDPNSFRNRLREGDIVIVSKGNSLFRAIGEVTGDYQYAERDSGEYCHRRSVRWHWYDRAGVPVEEIYAKGFTMATLYELTRDELNLPALERFIASGHGDESAVATGEPFVLIIDEINRANISKVFGELITLLEPDKRLGAMNELRVRLPYSKAMFGVPGNLHIIGTMNTADRSIALLDTALRRRFDFEELLPDSSTLEEGARLSGIDLPALLTTLNARIEYLFDREHQIGHAYFIGCRSKDDVDAVMRHKVIPLLAEYFYDDWSKVAVVLGDGRGEGGFLSRTQIPAPPDLDDEDAEPRWRWSVRPQFDPDAYIGLTQRKA